MVVDAHAHLFHPRWYPPAFTAHLIGQMGGDVDPSSRAAQVLLRALSDDSGATTVKAMDAAGIDRRVILIVDWGLELGEPESSLEEVHEEVLGICRRFPNRLVGFTGVDPRRPQAPELTAHAIDSLGARGLKLHPTSQDWTLAEPRTQRLISVAASRGVPVLVHVGATFPPLTDEHATPQALISLAERFPEVTFVAGHSGFSRWREFLRGGPLTPNVFLDISGWQSLDDGTYAFADELRAILTSFPDHVVFGTDSPFVGLPGAGADRRWLSRVREIAGSIDGGATGSLFNNTLFEDHHV